MYPKLLLILASMLLATGLPAQDASPSPESSPQESPAASPSPSPESSQADTPVEEPAEAGTDAPVKAEPSPALSPAPRDVAPENTESEAAASPEPDAAESDSPPTAAELRSEVEETIDLPTDQSPAGEETLPIADAPSGFVTESVTDSTFVEPSSFVPEDIGAAAQQLDAAIPQAPENQAEKERQLRLAYRKAKIELMQDERVQQLLEIAELAETPEEKRGALREYYTLVHDEIITSDPSLEGYSEDLRDAHYKRLKQRNVVPTTPLNPPPGIAPTPAPGGSRPQADGDQPPENNES